MKKIIFLFVILLFTLTNMRVNGQSNCSTADTVTNFSYVQEYNMQSTEYWLTFTADSSYFNLILFPTSQSQGVNIDSIILYNGNCSNLNRMSGICTTKDSILRFQTTIGQKYYIRAYRNGSSNGYFALNINRTYNYTPLNCSPPLCKINPNGDFIDMTASLTTAIASYDYMSDEYQDPLQDYKPWYGVYNYSNVCNWRSWTWSPQIEKESTTNDYFLYMWAFPGIGLGGVESAYNNNVFLQNGVTYNIDLYYKFNDFGITGASGFKIYAVDPALYNWYATHPVSPGDIIADLVTSSYSQLIKNVQNITTLTGWQHLNYDFTCNSSGSNFTTLFFHPYENGTGYHDISIKKISVTKAPDPFTIIGSLNDFCHQQGTFSVLNPDPNINYVWSVSSPLISTVTPSTGVSSDIKWNNASAGNITVKGYDVNGCLVYQKIISIDPSTLPSPTTQVTINGNIDDCMQGLFTITPYTPGLNYVWTVTPSPPAFIVNQSGDHVNINWNYGGNGNVTVQYIDASGCLVYDGITTITPTFNCVPNAHYQITTPSSDFIPNMFGNVGGSIGSQFSTAQQIYFVGTIHIDQDLYLTNCPDIYMSPNAKIIVDPGITFSVTSSHIRGCACPWDGIYVEDISSKVIFDDVIIQDAKNAVVSSYGGEYQIQNSYFVNNRIGIKVNHYENATSNHLGYIIHTKFDKDIISYGGPFSTTDNIGIDVKNVYGLTIGDNNASQNINSFSHLKYGIHIIQSDVSIYNNQFKYIGITSANPPSYSGIPARPNEAAIYTEISLNTQLPFYSITGNVIIGGSNFYSPNNFSDCNVGVFSYNTHVNVENNYFNHQNYVAIHLNECSRGSIVSNNTISMTSGVSSVSIPDASIISQLSTYTDLTNDLIIDGNTINDARIGIMLANCNGSHNILTPVQCNVTNNTINLDLVNLAICGIFSASGQYQFISTNTINYGTKLGYNAEGIYLADIYKSIIQNNYINKLYYGIIVKDQALYSEYSCNTLRYCDYGFTFAAANMTDQPLSLSYASDNIWIDGQQFYDGMRRMNGTTVNNPSPLWYQEDAIGSLLTFDTYIISGYPIFNYIVPFQNLNPNPNCISNKSSITNIQNTNTTIDLDKHLRKIIKDSITYNILSMENKYMAKEFAYNLLDNKPGLLNIGNSNDQVFQIFYNTVKNTNIGKFAKIQKHIKTKNYNAAKALNTTITTQNIIEANYKEVNRIYLNRIVNDSLVNASDSLILYNIAMQSPSTDGKAVYSARAILDIYIKDNIQQNNTFLPPTMQSLTETYSAIKAYPNPANDKLYIQLDNTLDGIAKVEFYDLAGKLIYSTTINASLKLQMLNISNLTKGIYNLRITANNKTNNQKLVIIK